MAKAKKETAEVLNTDEANDKIMASVEANASLQVVDPRLAELSEEIANAKHTLKSIQGMAAAHLREHMHRIASMAAKIGASGDVDQALHRLLVK